MENEDKQLLNDLFTAYYCARRNKRNTANQLRFELHQERNIFDLYRRITTRTYKPKQSIAFMVFHPVHREVFAANFSDRVVHHLFFNYTNPIFEKTLIEDCYSCRKGKGTSYAVSRLEHHIRSCSANYTRDCYILKLDLQGYFMSINRQLLYDKVEATLRKFENRRNEEGIVWKEKLDMDLVLYLAREIIFHDSVDNYFMKGKPEDWENLPPTKSLFHSAPGCGLPIGNLTSQLFSNVYLNEFDHFMKREMGFRHYGRYVDDFFVVHQDKELLKKASASLKSSSRRSCVSGCIPKKSTCSITPKEYYLPVRLLNLTGRM